MDTNTSIRLMIFEAGGLMAALPSHDVGQTLADSIETEANAALEAGEIHFDMELSPLDVGMALSATSGSQSPLAQTVAEKLKKGLAAKLEELGIQYPEQDEEPTAQAAPAASDDQSQDSGTDANAPADSDTTDAAPADEEQGSDDVL